MSQHPYQAPRTEVDEKLIPQRYYAYHSSALLTNVLTAFLLFFVIATATMGILDAFAIITVPSWGADDIDLSDSELLLTLLILATAVGSVLAQFICVVLFLMWMFHSTRNAHALRPQEVAVTPGWAIAYWFIPLVNLFRPYQATREIYRASQPDGPTEWKHIRIPWSFPLWWLFWIISGIVSQVEMQLAFRDFNMGDAELPFSIASTILACASGIFAVFVVRKISWSQQLRSAQLKNRSPNESVFLQPM